jgi:hypothetical protein
VVPTAVVNVKRMPSSIDMDTNAGARPPVAPAARRRAVRCARRACDLGRLRLCRLDLPKKGAKET